MLIIINADDLGIGKKVNDAIFSLMSLNKISSATLLANGPSVKEASKKLLELEHCSFGVHLNLTEFKPLSDNNKLNAILDQDGRFSYPKLKQMKMNPSISKAIFSEFSSQIDYLFDLGFNISHIDSHHHIHTLAKLFIVLKRIQKKYKIRKVRISQNIYNNQRVTKFLIFKTKVYNFALRNYYSTKTSLGFTDFITFFEKAKKNKLPYGFIEIMVHPGADDEQFEKENKLLESSWEKDLPFNIKLINYTQI